MIFIHLLSPSFTRTLRRPPESLVSSGWWRWERKGSQPTDVNKKKTQSLEINLRCLMPKQDRSWAHAIHKLVCVNTARDPDHTGMSYTCTYTHPNGFHGDIPQQLSLRLYFCGCQYVSQRFCVSQSLNTTHASMSLDLREGQSQQQDSSSCYRSYTSSTFASKHVQA